MSKILDFLRERVLLADGAMGTRVQALDLTVDTDFLGAENCTDILTKSRPDLVRDIHKSYFAAGSDAVET
ncbi:MAG: homocysteine S-methyltransferase family protein, partial [Alphaproteobacteria bacterium]